MADDRTIRDSGDADRTVEDADDTNRTVVDADEANRTVIEHSDIDRTVRDPGGINRMVRDASNIGATVREAAGGDATVRDASDAGATVRDDSTSDNATIRDESPSQRMRTRIPLSAVLERRLAGEYVWVRDLPAGGAEADCAIYRDSRDGGEVFLKVYRSGYSPDEAALRALQALGSDAIAEIIDFNCDSNDAWEMQRYYAEGSLKDYLSNNPQVGNIKFTRAILKQLCRAIKTVHDAGVALRDLKPGNVLIASLEPYRLVLTDFGIARAHQDFSHFSTHVKGTWQYAAPEVHDAVSSQESDWFALGAIIYELICGLNLFVDDDGNPVANSRIPALCIRGEYATVPVASRLADPKIAERWQLLVDGLLVYERAYRWGAEQVEAWLRGESPEVMRGAPSEEQGRVAVSYYPSWAGVDAFIETPEELAQLLVDHWNEASALLIGRPDDSLINFLEMNGLSQATPIVKSVGGNADRKMIQLQKVLRPDVPIVYRGRSLERAALAATIDAAQGGDADARRWLVGIVEQDILRFVAEAEGDETLLHVGLSLHEWHEEARVTAEMVPHERLEVARAAYQAAIAELYTLAFRQVAATYAAPSYEAQPASSEQPATPNSETPVASTQVTAPGVR